MHGGLTTSVILMIFIDLVRVFIRVWQKLGPVLRIVEMLLLLQKSRFCQSRVRIWLRCNGLVLLLTA